MKKGLYSNINAKKKRIEAGSGERPKKKGEKGIQQLRHLKWLKKQQKKDDNKKR